MTRSFQPAGVAVAVTLSVAAVLATGCSAGQTAQTAMQNSTVDGTEGNAGDIGLRFVRLAYPDGGRYAEGATATLEFIAVNSGPLADRLESVRTDAAAQVTMRPVGSVTSGPAAGATTASGSATSTGTAGPARTGTATASGTATATTGPTGTATATTGPTGTATATAPARVGQVPVPLPPNGLVVFQQGGATVQLLGLTRELVSGQTLTITFSFARGGTLTLDVPVATPLSPLPRPSAVPTTTAAP